MKATPNEGSTVLQVRAALADDLPTVFDIRKQVFVLEQDVHPDEEYD